MGSAIEELYADRLAEHYAELAHHFAQAEEWRKAMEYSTLAGSLAGDAFANAEAKAHYGRALQAAQNVTPPPDGLTLADVGRAGWPRRGRRVRGGPRR